MITNILDKLSQYTDEVLNLAKELNLTPPDIAKLWHQYLQELKENNISAIMPKDESVLDWIENLSNFNTKNKNIDEGVNSSLYDEIYNTSIFWNESVINAINYFKDCLNNEKNIDSTEYIKEDLLKADAGRSFQSSAWVWPHYSPFDKNKTYDSTRGEDATLSVLKKFTNMQYTHSQPISAPPADEIHIDKWLRLLMPKNSHSVEIEDLNRNFWVIAAFIDALSAYLWDENGELPIILGHIFDEITQLWENIAYLWVTLAAATQKKNNDIRIEIIPLPNNTLQSYRKFDDFNEGNIPLVGEVQKRIDYLRYKYSEQNLIVIPVIRRNNYARNYYSKESYPYLFWLNRNDETWHYFYLYYKNTNKFLTFDIQNTDESNGPVFNNLIAAAREEDYYHMYTSPFSNIDNQEYEGKRFYGLTRIVPQVAAEITNEGLKITALNWFLYDAAAIMSGDIDNTKYFKTIGCRPVEIPLLTTQNSAKKVQILNEWTHQSGIAPNKDIVKINKNNNSYYMGELISFYKKTAIPKFTDAEFKIVKIGDFLPDIVANNPQNFEMITVETGGEGIPYDTATYGYGAMRNKIAISQSDIFHLIFANYCWYDAVQQNDPTLNQINHGTWHCGEGYHVTPDVLSRISINRVENLVKLGILSSKDGLYATKIGISYWTGNDGIQWSSGLVCNLIYYSADDTKAYDMGFVGLLDGYWTNDTNVFSYYNGNRWRRLALKADKVSIKTVGDNRAYTMNGGRLVWYDHNKEVYYGNYEHESIRPHAEMNLSTNDGISKLIFSNPQPNTLSNKQMYPYIDYPSKHIFKSSESQLSVNQQYGVNAWKNYNANDVNLRPAANLGSYIVTLEV